MPALRFHLYTFAGSWLWCFGLAYVGARLGDAWDRNPMLKATFHRFDLAIVAAVILSAGAFIWHRLRGPVRS
jgi:membrane protein DedA with SNARE-associated domain